MFERGGQADDQSLVGYPYRLTLFGKFSLCAADGRVVTGLSRKSRALIAYLALTPRLAGRDSLAELLWDGRAIEQARASLRQACYELRHHLPTDTPLLTFERGEIGIVRDNLVSDIDDLADDPPGLLAALAPSRRELLRDLNGLSSAFDEWLRVERSRLSEQRRGMALDSAREALAGRRWSQAKTIANSLLTLDPTDEDAVEIALRALGHAGNLKEAQAIYSRHTDALRHELDVSPAPGNAALFEGLAQAQRSGKPRPAARRRDGREERILWRMPSVAPAQSDGKEALLSAASRRWGTAGMFLAILAAGALVGGAQLRRATAMPGTALVDVEPLAIPAGDQAAAAVSASLRSSLVQQLAGTETPVQVVDGTASKAEPIALTVRGNSLDDHGRLRANLEIVAGTSGEVIWAGTFSRPDSQLDDFVQQLSLQIAHELHCAYAEGRGPYFDRDPEFARLSLSHCDAVGIDVDDTTRFDAQITRRAPGFARGWAEYAMDTALASEELPSELQAANNRRAEDYARRALSLDAKQGLAYTALAETHQYGPWRDRQTIVSKGLHADPTNPELHMHFAENLASIGRPQEALRESRLAYEYDHLLPGKVFFLGMNEVWTGDLDGASDTLAVARRYWPDHPFFNYLALLIGLGGKEPAEALKLLKAHRIRVDPERERVLEAFLEWRIAPSAATNAAAVNAIETEARRNGPSPDDVRFLASLGHLDAAYELAKRVQPQAVDDPDWFRPDLQAFRADPRFMALAARLGLAQTWMQTGVWPDFCLPGNVGKCRAEVAAALAKPHARAAWKA